MTAASHILSDEWLVDYAAGTAPEPVAAFVATHLSLNAAARKAYACVEAVGGRLLEAIEPVAVGNDALAQVLARLDEPVPARARDAADGPLPATLRRYAPRGLGALRWRRLTRGLQAARLITDPVHGYYLSLLHLKPGHAVPRHTHRGDELVMVLDGGYEDEHGHFGVGDVEMADTSVVHRPVADPGPVCVGLILAQAPVRLTGFPGRLLNPLLRLR